MTIDFQQIQDDVNTIKETVLVLREQINLAPIQPANHKPLSLSEAAEFLGISDQTIYQNIKKLPHRKKFGRLYFFTFELLAYLDGNVFKP